MSSTVRKLGLISVNFEIFGKVQGVYFRKHTQEKGESLGLKVYCENTPEGTVVGTLQGEKDKVEEMKIWLEKTGSPKSRIDKAEFRDETIVEDFSYKNFSIRR